MNEKFASERDLRLGYRPQGTEQYTSDFSGTNQKYGVDPYVSDANARDAINDTVEVLFIGGGFSGVETIGVNSGYFMARHLPDEGEGVAFSNVAPFLILSLIHI